MSDLLERYHRLYHRCFKLSFASGIGSGVYCSLAAWLGAPMWTCLLALGIAFACFGLWRWVAYERFRLWDEKTARELADIERRLRKLCGTPEDS